MPLPWRTKFAWNMNIGSLSRQSSVVWPQGMPNVMHDSLKIKSITRHWQGSCSSEFRVQVVLSLHLWWGCGQGQKDFLKHRHAAQQQGLRRSPSSKAPNQSAGQYRPSSQCKLWGPSTHCKRCRKVHGNVCLSNIETRNLDRGWQEAIKLQGLTSSLTWGA